VIALQRSQVETQTGDDDVGLLGQTMQCGLSIGRGEIDLPRILAQIQMKEELGADARSGGIKRRHGPDCRAPWRFYQAHLGALVGEHATAKLPGHALAQVKHPQPAQCTG
jgi:hypothetical protein